MRSRAKMIGATIGGAAVLASGAYAVGAQAGNGNAEAASKASKASGAQSQQGYGPAGERRPGDCGPGGRHGGPRGAALADTAKKLGVSEAKLREAFDAVRKDLFDGKKPEKGDTPEKMRDAFATALAKELGVSKDKVESALPKGPAGGPGPMGRHGGPGGPGGPPPMRGGNGTPPAPPAAP